LLLTSTLFPYTTLFRSCCSSRNISPVRRGLKHLQRVQSPLALSLCQKHFPDEKGIETRWCFLCRLPHPHRQRHFPDEKGTIPIRSEEHTSELQSLRHLV